MPSGYDISASVSTSTNSASGAGTQGGSDARANFLGAVGGSNGISVTTLLILAGVAYGVWFLFIKKGRK